MSRTVAEWIGKTDDSRPPPRVRLRILDRFDSRCYRSGVEIRPGDAWQCDHILALTNGGENRETNLAPILTEPHKAKTASDVKIKAKTARIRKKSMGVWPKSRGLGKHPTLVRGLDGKVRAR